MKLLFKRNVNDPGTFITHYAGVEEVDEDTAARLIGHHPEYVEELTEDNLTAKNKAEILEVAQAAGADVDGSEKKDELVKKAIKN